MIFRDYNGEPIRDGFYFRDQPGEIYAIGKVEISRFTILSDRFPHAYIVPQGTVRGKTDEEQAYEEFASELTRIDNNNNEILTRPSVVEMRKTLKERLAAA